MMFRVMSTGWVSLLVHSVIAPGQRTDRSPGLSSSFFRQDILRKMGYGGIASRARRELTTKGTHHSPDSLSPRTSPTAIRKARLEAALGSGLERSIQGDGDKEGMVELFGRAGRSLGYHPLDSAPFLFCLCCLVGRAFS